MTNHSWLDKELSRQLAPVSAPDSLWNQIHEQRRPLRIRPSHWKTWSIAIAALLMVSTFLAWRYENKSRLSPDLETLAVRELRGLANGSPKADLPSTDPQEIRNWVHAKLNIDVELPNNFSVSTPVHLLGTRLIQFKKSPAAVITYRVGNDFAAMLVTDHHGNPTVGARRHASPPRKSASGVQLYSWTEGNQDYAIAFGGADPRGGCLLCHAGTPALMVFQ